VVKNHKIHGRNSDSDKSGPPPTFCTMMFVVHLSTITKLKAGEGIKIYVGTNY